MQGRERMFSFPLSVVFLEIKKKKIMKQLAKIKVKLSFKYTY